MAPNSLIVDTMQDDTRQQLLCLLLFRLGMSPSLVIRQDEGRGLQADANDCVERALAMMQSPDSARFLIEPSQGMVWQRSWTAEIASLRHALCQQSSLVFLEARTAFNSLKTPVVCCYSLALKLRSSWQRNSAYSHCCPSSCCHVGTFHRSFC